MPLFTLAASVTRATVPGGPLADLSLESSSYHVVTAGPGASTWRIQYVESPNVHGAFPVAAVKALQTAPLAIRCTGSSRSNLDTLVAALLRAFEQTTYRLTVTVDGQANTWDCYPADAAPMGSGEWDPNLMRSFMQTYAFQIPRQPVAVAGPH